MAMSLRPPNSRETEGIPGQGVSKKMNGAGEACDPHYHAV